jgi:hypothetical protein
MPPEIRPYPPYPFLSAFVLAKEGTASPRNNRQLGLKLEKQKRPVPVLVIDHINEKPTEN